MPTSVIQRLYSEGYVFDFFQAVRVLGLGMTARAPVGYGVGPADEVVRFRAHLSLAFPPSAIHEVIEVDDVLPPDYLQEALLRPTEERLAFGPVLKQTFFGMFGPSGVLPAHYTELMLKLDHEAKNEEHNALRSWLDLFNHRLTSLFYRAWEKYRFYPGYERGVARALLAATATAGRGRSPLAPRPEAEHDWFTHTLLNFLGLGLSPLRDRLRVHWFPPKDVEPGESVSAVRRTVLAVNIVEGPDLPIAIARIDDLALIYYAGLLSHRPRNAVSLTAILNDFFGLPMEVLQFQGQWLILDEANQSRMGGENANNSMGLNLVAGERVWDVQSKIRIRIGPLTRAEFTAFVPDRRVPGDLGDARNGSFFLLVHLVRLYLGPEFDFDVQLVLKASDVPPCKMSSRPGVVGARLGWNSWALSKGAGRDVDDAVFEGEEVYDIAD